MNLDLAENTNKLVLLVVAGVALLLTLNTYQKQVGKNLAAALAIVTIVVVGYVAFTLMSRKPVNKNANNVNLVNNANNVNRNMVNNVNHNMANNVAEVNLEDRENIEGFLGEKKKNIMKKNIMKKNIMNENIMKENIMKENIMKENIMKKNIMKKKILKNLKVETLIPTNLKK